MSIGDSEPFTDTISYDLILNQLPSRLRQRILNPPISDEDKDKNIYYVIKSLQKLDFASNQIKPFLSNYTISLNRDLDADILRVKEGNPSENQLSRKFSNLYKNKLSYCPEWGKWLTFNGNYWETTRHLAIEYIRQTLEQSDMPEFRRRASTVKGIEYLAQSDPELISYTKDWDQNPYLLATPSGTVDLSTGKFRLSYPEDKITRITSISPEDVPIPLWTKFLSESTNNNQQFISYLQRISGYCLTGFIKEQALFFFYGSGGNGKGVFLNTIKSILGDYAISAPMGMFMDNKFDSHPTELALLRGARLVTAQETQEGKAWNETRIKALTGGDPITARFMHENFFEFQPTFKLLIAGNHEPQLKNIDDAIKRRFNKLPFDHKPPTVDLNLSEKLISEYPGILHWMIQGCISWQNFNLSPPQIIIDSTEDYFEDQNNIQLWLNECCVLDPNYKTTSSKAFTSWCAWASRNHFRQGTDRTLKEQLLRCGIIYNKNIPEIDSKGKTSRVRGYEGFKLK